jgi:hypothetical protein
MEGLSVPLGGDRTHLDFARRFSNGRGQNAERVPRRRALWEMGAASRGKVGRNKATQITFDKHSGDGHRRRPLSGAQ